MMYFPPDGDTKLEKSIFLDRFITLRIIELIVASVV